nr:hypothetical protein Iba_chr05eCG8050 [Ipomoea batatas]
MSTLRATYGHTAVQPTPPIPLSLNSTIFAIAEHHVLAANQPSPSTQPSLNPDVFLSLPIALPLSLCDYGHDAASPSPPRRRTASPAATSHSQPRRDLALPATPQPRTASAHSTPPTTKYSRSWCVRRTGQKLIATRELWNYEDCIGRKL